MAMPANIRKRSEIYAKNIHKRGHVRKSLDPRVEQKLEAERQRKQGLGSGIPTPSSGSRRIVLGMLAVVVGSVLYQVFSPTLFGGRAVQRSAKKPAMTKDHQARAAEAVLRAMNDKHKAHEHERESGAGISVDTSKVSASMI